MQGAAVRLVRIGMMAMVLSAGGCASSGVGDPCIPEKVPCSTNPDGTEVCGYDDNESYVEGSSVQCKSRVCLVHQLQGNPKVSCADNPDDAANCVSAEDLTERIYCSCRCDAPAEAREGNNFDFCKCPSGFVCPDVTEPVLPLGGQGIRGSYCIRKLDGPE